MKFRVASKVRELMRKDRDSVTSPSIRQRVLAFLRLDSDGGALVEAAIAMPVYLILITGVLSTVSALYSYQQLAFATFTASEVLGAGRGTITTPCTTVVTQVLASLPTWTASNFTYTVYITEDGSGTVQTDTYGPWTGSTPPASCTGTYNVAGNGNYSLYNAQNEPVTVRVSYQYNWYPIYAKVVSSGPLVAAESSLVR